jgi:hypothetical protein
MLGLLGSQPCAQAMQMVTNMAVFAETCIWRIELFWQ